MGEDDKENIIYHNNTPVEVNQWEDDLEFKSDEKYKPQELFIKKIYKKEPYEHYVLRKCRKGGK